MENHKKHNSISIDEDDREQTGFPASEVTDLIVSKVLPFVFRAPNTGPPENCDQLFSGLLGYLLDTLQLTENGRPIEADGFYFKNIAETPANPIPIRFPESRELPPDSRRVSETAPYQPFAAIIASEPRLSVLGYILSMLMSALQMYENGALVTPDGFGPRRLSTWTTPGDGDPSSLLTTLARSCDSACTFCYLESNPPDLCEARGDGFASDLELDAGLSVLCESKGAASLFKSNWEIRETLADPRALPYMRRLREVTAKPLFFVTNGNHIDSNLAAELSALMPVTPFISINVLDEEARQQVMGMQKTNVSVIEALRELGRSHVPFGLSVTAWPGPTMEKLGNTLLRAAETGAAFIRVNLPGYTRYCDTPEWDTDSVWTEIVDIIRDARKQSIAPIFPIPSLFEVETTWDDPLAVRVMGVVPDSPSSRAGLLEGDVLLEFDGMPLVSRLHALSLLNIADDDLCVLVRRNGVDTRITLPEGPCPHLTDDYVGKYFFPRGLIIPWSLPSGIGETLGRIVETNRCGRLLHFVSPFLARSARLLLQSRLEPYGSTIEIVTPTPEYLGGNIRVMDMCVVDDFVSALNRCDPRPDYGDLALIPATAFNRWGRDLRGVHWQAIERRSGVKTRLLSCASITF